MIHYVTGDLLDNRPRLDILVNTVNCVGATGAGLVKAFAAKYPNATADYRRDCDAGVFHPGDARLYVERSQLLLFAATKSHWRNPSRHSWVYDALGNIHWHSHQQAMMMHRPVTIALPPLGAGLGGLDPHDIFQMVQHWFKDDDGLIVYYFLPS